LPEARLVEDLKLDSIDLAEMLVLAEDAFGLKISDDEVKSMKTIACAVEYLDKRLAK
jgi:acyl carrier protein